MPKNKSLKAVLGENVAALMEAKKLNQTKVAAAAKKAGTKIDQTTVSRVANAVFPATVDTIEAIANGLGVQPWQLLIPSATDERFVGMLNAWTKTNEQGRKLLALAARGALEQEVGEAVGGGASVTDIRRARTD